MGLTGPIASSVPAVAALPKVPSLVFDMELEDGMTSSHASEEVDVRIVELELRNYLRPDCDILLQLTHDVDDAIREQLSSRTTDEPRQVDVPKLARSLTMQGYVACLRRAVGGGEGPSCLQNLRHNFLSITRPGLEGAAFVVDPLFTEQFLIAKPTPRYTTILACLPSILNIPEDRLAPLVTFLCAELAMAFKASNTVVPPWRQASSVLSKWKPRTSIDETYRPCAPLHSGLQVEPAAEPATASTGQAPQPHTLETLRESQSSSPEVHDQRADALFPRADQGVQAPRAAAAVAITPPVFVAATQQTRVTVGFAGSKINSSGLSLLKGLLHSS